MMSSVMRATKASRAEIVVIGTPTLGDRSYLVHDGSVALVIDPQRDIDRVLTVAAERGVRITHVFETHVHNDYVTGGLALAQSVGADYHVNGADAVAFHREPVRDQDVIDIGPLLRIRVMATPGHTLTHLSYVLESALRPQAVFTGGSLLYGSTGRPDLMGAGWTAELAHAQFASARRLAASLPEDAAIYPTHGFGSFCSATQSEGAASTIGRERRVNPALTLDERRYVTELLAGLDSYPSYYARMAAANAAGPGVPDLAPPRAADADELRRRIAAREWVVDLRARRAFAAGHLAGSLSFGLDGRLATYLGWLLPRETPLTLLGHTLETVAEAQRELSRVGIDRPAAMAVGEPAGWSAGGPLRSFSVAEFSDLEVVRHDRHVVILDVRRDLEWAASHIDSAIHVPLHELADSTPELPDEELWVHCRSGYRASVAASMLARAGRPVVLVDDDFDRAARAGLPLVGESTGSLARDERVRHVRKLRAGQCGRPRRPPPRARTG